MNEGGFYFFVNARGNHKAGYRAALLDLKYGDIWECPHRHRSTTTAYRCGYRERDVRTRAIDEGVFV